MRRFKSKQPRLFHKHRWRLHLPGVNLRTFLAEIYSIKTTHLSGKLLGFLSCGTSSNNGIL